MTPELCMKKAEKEGVSAVLQSMDRKVYVRLIMRKSFLDLPLDELPLSVRSRNALMRNGLNTIGRLVDYIEKNDSMSSIRNLGKKSICEVKSLLTEAAYDRLNEKEKLEFWQYTLNSAVQVIAEQPQDYIEMQIERLKLIIDADMDLCVGKKMLEQAILIYEEMNNKH